MTHPGPKQPMGDQQAHHGTVHVIDDDEHMRRSLSALLELEGYGVATYESAEHFLAQWPGEDGALCLLVDLRLPDMSGLELHRALTEAGHHPPVVLITGHGDVPTAVRALKDGAFDFLEKPLDNERVLERVSACMRESARRASEEADQDHALERLAVLTQRERQVFDLLVEGLRNQDIAERLSISVRTVESHRLSVMDKLEAGSVPDLVRLIYRAGAG